MKDLQHDWGRLQFNFKKFEMWRFKMNIFGVYEIVDNFKAFDKLSYLKLKF